MDNPHGTTFYIQLIELESVDSTNNYAMARAHAGLASAGHDLFCAPAMGRKRAAGKDLD